MALGFPLFEKHGFSYSSKPRQNNIGEYSFLLQESQKNLSFMIPSRQVRGHVTSAGFKGILKVGHSYVSFAID